METLGATHSPEIFEKASATGRITLIAVAMGTISIWSILGFFAVWLVNRGRIHSSPWVDEVGAAIIAAPLLAALLCVLVSEGGMAFAHRRHSRPTRWYFAGWIVYALGVLCAVVAIPVCFVLP
jgi:hypothetical protein